MPSQHHFEQLGLAVIETEAAAIDQLKSRINADFSKACEIMLACQGRIVVLGMGKSGHIANKIAATLASTGTPAFYVHPGEASHGDLGMITRQDVVFVISYSGNTPEVLTLLPLIKRFNIPMIALTGNKKSPIAQAANVHIDASVEKEACPLNLAPTASTTAALVLGDALAIALLDARGFTENDFALSHPGGHLGKRLLLHIDDVMHTGSDIPCVKPEATLSQAIIEMSSKKLGMTAIVDKKNVLLGILTDGDLRRVIDKNLNFNQTQITDVMTKKPVTAPTGILAFEALQLLEKHKITGLFVTDSGNHLIGALNIHDLFRAGVL